MCNLIRIYEATSYRKRKDHRIGAMQPGNILFSVLINKEVREKGFYMTHTITIAVAAAVCAVGL